MSSELRVVPIGDLHDHPHNPRKHFDQVKLEELAASIREHGVLNPLLVRRNGRGLQLLSGHRRFRAAALAELRELPVLVREIDDAAALEIVVIDNLQRDDLHPLEEAEGYAALMKQAGYDVDAIAQKISKSAKYVYDRVKLLQLIPELRQVFLGGEITAGHAILLARLGASDQQRCMGKPSRNGYVAYTGGLFQRDAGDDAPGLELDDGRKRKAVSVRELDTWINDNVRFQPGEVDLPNLFPSTAEALAAAADEELKVVKITHDYRVPDAARDEKERTYGRPSWKRADGEIDHDLYGRKSKPSRTCEHSVMGVVVAGPGRGEAFRVCVAKKKCKVHWAAEMKEAEKRKESGTSPAASREAAAQRERKWQEERKREEEERDRWKKAGPALLEALAEKLQETPALDLVDLLVDAVKPYGGRAKQLARGETLEEAVRYMAFLHISQSVLSPWQAPRSAPAALRPYGIDARKIVDQVAPKPKPKPEKTKAEASVKKDGRKAAGARAAAKARKAKRVQTAAKSES